MILVFPYSFGEIGSHTDVQGAVALARQDVDGKIFLHCSVFHFIKKHAWRWKEIEVCFV